MQVFQGIWPALVTPSNAEGGVNVAVLRDLIEYQIAKGVDGFYIGGTTGEGIFMPLADRKLVAEVSMNQIKGRVPVIMHVGAIAAADAVDLAKHAYEHGAAGISSVIPPMYENMDGLVQYYRAVAGAVPQLPFMAYLLNPRIDGVSLVSRLMDIPNFAGSKYTGPNMYEFRQILDMGTGWTMFSGMDEQAIYGLMMGATGLIGSTLNFMPGVYRKIYEAVQQGRQGEAQEWQLRANRITAAMIAVGFSGALKSVLSDLVGQEMGAPRLPALPLSTEQRAALRDKLAQLDFDELTQL
jgi:N-acetylneuraminate lyase